jgi:hypothetical protein
MQALVDRIRFRDYPANVEPSGIVPVIATSPPSWAEPSPETSAVNARIREYNRVVTEELTGHARGPDVFAFFLPEDDTTRASLFSDALHPNGLGHHLLAVLWYNALRPDRQVPMPFFLDRLSSSGASPQQNLLEQGDRLYLDSDATLVRVPSALRDGRWIVTANGDRDDRSNDYLRFRVDRPVTVYVAYDAGAEHRPAWLAGFADGGAALTTTCPEAPVMRLYSRAFDPGEVMLGGNVAPPAVGADGQYVAIVVAQPAR